MAELYLVEFKGSRKEYFYNSYHHTLTLSDYVIVQAEQGEDIGLLSKRVEAKMDFSDTTRPRSILRPAAQEDRLHYEEQRKREGQYKKEIGELIRRHGLVMKIIDVEGQFDGNKITFYFTAEHRVDFRSLVRELASRYRTRIELRQIGVRDEARRTDGYGICGRRQCCNSFIKEFAPISTTHAREQDMSLNPSKISGNCGRLLCCLRYEVDSYAKVKRQFPPIGSLVVATSGKGILQRVDVFKEEAVLLTEENVQIRAKVTEIISTQRGQTGESRPAARVTTDYDDDKSAIVDEREELKRLDESEGAR